MPFHDPSDPSIQPGDSVGGARQQAAGGAPRRSWTLHLLIGITAGPLLGAAVFARTGGTDLGLAALLMLAMIPVAFAVSALATPSLIRLARWLGKHSANIIIFVARITRWQPRETPPPNEYLLHLHTPQQALAEGFLGPLNLYFRPSMIFSRHEESYFSYQSKHLLALFYLSSFAWLPKSFLVSVLIAGIPSTKTIGLTGTLALAMVLLGLARGFGFSGTRPRRYELYPDFVWFFGVFFAAAFIFDQVLFDRAPQGSEALLAMLAASTRGFFTLFPTFVIGGILGLAAALGSLMGTRNLVRAAYVVSLFLFASMLWSSTMRRLDLVLAAVALVFISTHIAYQPVYFIWSVVSGWLVRARPDWSKLLWRWSPPRLTEYVYVPQPGTVKVVRKLRQTDPQEAARAVRFLCRHPFQRRSGWELWREWLAEGPLHPMTL